MKAKAVLNCLRHVQTIGIEENTGMRENSIMKLGNSSKEKFPFSPQLLSEAYNRGFWGRHGGANRVSGCANLSRLALGLGGSNLLRTVLDLRCVVDQNSWIITAIVVYAEKLFIKSNKIKTKLK